MKENIFFNELKIDEINSFSNMVKNVFEKFVGMDYSEEGNKTFKEYIRPENILARFNEKTSQIFAAKYDNEIIGILEIKNKDHISLFFVKKEFHDKGIGKKLFENYIEALKREDNGIKAITVNSSFYAEKIYTKLGFQKTDIIQESNGIKYIPMKYILYTNSANFA
jgi:GNAT superfamily N-acetyltransferase